MLTVPIGTWLPFKTQPLPAPALNWIPIQGPRTKGKKGNTKALVTPICSRACTSGANDPPLVDVLPCKRTTNSLILPRGLHSGKVPPLKTLLGSSMKPRDPGRIESQLPEWFPNCKLFLALAYRATKKLQATEATKLYDFRLKKVNMMHWRGYEKENQEGSSIERKLLDC